MKKQNKVDKYFTENYQRVLRYSNSIIGDRGGSITCSDVAHDGYCKMKEYVDGHPETTAEYIHNMLYTVLLNTFRNIKRRNTSLLRIKEELTECNNTDITSAFCGTASPSPEDFGEIVLNKVSSTEMLEILEGIPTKYKIPIEAFYFKEEKYAEISEHLDIPIGTVKSRIARGKQEMRKELCCG